ncbi:PilW family protein [Variovorax sp. J31P179]|jgi:type IV pilus assembly protein PilW|uniref:PilW family protein n=1 Tax=Variovorax sp. J31P179 TaxID=3053508 RepID=UPI002576D93D|nr:PilW family protein [Variovorax sp. J31P179]MDM0080870.1 PilW family protein [Variovorax sp. J31P179]
MRGSHTLVIRSHARSRRVQRGLTLIELMVSITITLIVVAALIALFLNVSNAQREMAKINQQIESGRVSMFVLENEIAHAGFWENYMPQFDDLTLTTIPANVPTGAPPDPCLAYTPANWTPGYMRSLLDVAVQVYDAVPAGCAAVLKNKKANTDVLVVRHAETCLPSPTCGVDTPGALYFQSSTCGTQKPSDFDLSTAGFATMLARNCTTPSPKRKFVSDIYYVRDYADTVGDGIPTLARSRFDLSGGALGQQPPVALIEGIEGFRVELGLDTLSSTGAAVDYTKATSWADASNRSTPTDRGDGSPDGAFVHCSAAAPCTADQLINAVAVKIYVLARSIEQTPSHTDSRSYTLGGATLGPFNDHYKRHAFSSSVRLNNVAGRRDTP